jgi:DNA polymerase III subunit gamma/tau
VSYQVIARKYRPQTFTDLTGQDHITRTLSHALEQGRLHHAYLFSGVRGTGKTTSARILAKGLNCQTGITSQPCLQCASCREIAAGHSLDVLEIDAASNTGVDNVRDVIINNIALAPARDRYKVFVIDEVHMLSTSAFNALLKTLEEPPPHAIFIMATTELHKVPDTILSRCQQFEFRQIPTEKIFLRLREIAAQESIKITDAALREIARAGAGSLRDAQSAFDQVIAFSGAEITEAEVTTSLGLVSAATLSNFVAAIAGQNAAQILSLVEDVATRGYDLRNFARELMAYLRHLLVVKSGITSGESLGVADVEIARLQQLAAQFSEEDLVRCFHLLADTEKEIKDSPQPRFQLELGLVKLTHATRLRSLDELIKRLEALEAELNRGTTGASQIAPPFKPTSTQAATTPVKADAPHPVPRASTITREPEQSEKPSTPVVRATAPSLDEPPDFPDFDLSEPPDLSGTDDNFTPSPARSSEPFKPAATPATPTINSGNEKQAILTEIRRLNRTLVETTLEEAQQWEYQDGALVATYGAENIYAKRLRESGALFREIGERLFNQPLRIEVRISGQVEERVNEAEAQRQQLHERARQSPAVRLVLDEMRGEIVWVKEAGANKPAAPLSQ